MTTVLLTGATGVMGRATLRHLRRRGIATRVLLLPGEAIEEASEDEPEVEIVIGDLRDAQAVGRAVDGVDLVLHVAAVVSPKADTDPALAHDVNVGGLRVLLDAVRARGDIAFVGIGSVAQYGDRPAPIHWGRVGDPQAPSIGDHYALTKVEGERLVVDGGLSRWLWLRQTGILHAGLLSVRDPIATHTPLDGVLEWISDEDSGRLLAAIAAGELPEQAWNDVHNIGGGPGWRLGNATFLRAMGRAIGVRDMLAWYERRWFALGNFHGLFYTDSDDLARLVPFRAETFEDAVARIVREAPASVRWARFAPAWLIRRAVMRPLAHAPRGTQHAIVTSDDAAIGAHYGSRAAHDAIGTWAEFTEHAPDMEPVRLDHGYDESVPPDRWDAQLLAGAAGFRGGEFLGPAGQVGTPAGDPIDEGAGRGSRETARWRCADGHEFELSPFAVLRVGQWCPECVADPTDSPRQARANRFLAQVGAGRGWASTP